MNLVSISFPASTKNINATRRLAREKEYTLKQEQDETFSLIDNQNGEQRFFKVSLAEIYEFLLRLDA